MTQTAEIPDGVVRLDLQFGGLQDVIAAYVIGDGDDRLLFETGPTTTIETLSHGLEAAGIAWDQIAAVAVSHIHLDHAGAAGVLLRQHPHLRLLVHPVGAPHMVNPEKLIGSAARIYKDRMAETLGEIAPVAQDRIDLLTDDSEIRFGGHTLRVKHVLGHASHHVVLLDEATGVLFTGDAAGVRVGGSDYVGAATPPPEFDPAAWTGAIHAMRSLNAKYLALTHSDVFADVGRHLDDVAPANDAFIEAARFTFANNGGWEELIRNLQRVVRQGAGNDAAFAKLELADPAYVSAMGLERYLRKLGEPTLAQDS